ncbi:MAG: hypothetical protein AN482_13385 [Anabaena sp. LE011-02]|nr:MAG: hypothetical protein AN482_13385 [Anabaena sp. LE011-02]
MAIQNRDGCYFSEVAQDWDLERLFKDINTSGIEDLPSAQQRNLKAILLGLSPKDTSLKLGLGKKSLDSAFSDLYRIIERLTDQPARSVTYKNAPLVLAKYRKGGIIDVKLEFDLLGRNGDRTELEKLQKQHKVILIKAGAGIGKSTLAKEFLRTHFQQVIEINMGLSSGAITPASEKLSAILQKELGEEPSHDFGINLDILKTRLFSKLQPSIGILIDNLEPALNEEHQFDEKLLGYEDLLAVLGDLSVCSFTLITSRRSLNVVRGKKVDEYLLNGLDITAWRQYFHDCENVKNSKDLVQIRDAFNGNAKAMDIIHSAIKNQNRFDRNIEAYWNRYKDALLADPDLKSLISVEMDWLRDNHSNAYKLLCRMGCYRYQDVKTVPFDGLICLLWDVPEYAGRVGVVEYLSKTSLIEFKGEYYLHPAVREAAKLRLKNKMDWEKANLAISDFYESISNNLISIEDAILYLESIHHAITAKQFSKALNLLLNHKIDKPFPCSILRSFGYSSTSISYFNCILKDKQIANDSVNLIYIYGLLGDAYSLSGMLKDGIDSYEKSLSFYPTPVIKYHHELLQDWWVDVQGALSLTYLHFGDYSKSENLFKECLENARHLNESGNKYLCYIYACLAFLACEAKNYLLAEEFINKSLELLEFLENTYHTWIRSYGLYYLSRSLTINKMFSKAESVLLNLSSFAKNHSYLLSQNLVILGESYLYSAQNNNLMALQKLLDVKIKCEKIDNSYELADIYFQIGLVHQAMGEHNQAEEYKVKTLKLFEQMEAPKQIERVKQAFAGNIQ